MHGFIAMVALMLTLIFSVGSAAPHSRSRNALGSPAVHHSRSRNALGSPAVPRSRSSNAMGSASLARNLDTMVSSETTGLEVPTNLIVGTGAGTGAMQLVINVHTDSYGNIEVFTN